VLSIDGTDPFDVAWAVIGERVGVAHVTRAETKAVLVAVFDGDGSVDAATMRSFEAELTPAHPVASLGVAFDWILGHAPPVAAVAYHQGNPNVGTDTVAMCLASTFFSNCDHRLTR
jgi:hypothetical protein